MVTRERSASSSRPTGLSCGRTRTRCSARCTTPRTPCRRRCCARGAGWPGSRAAVPCARGCTRSSPTRPWTSPGTGRGGSCPSTSGRLPDRQTTWERRWPNRAGWGPSPDRWLTGDPGSSPEATYEQRESMELAFIVALQKLPPLQRAVLLLREVVGFSAAETADQLGASVASVNSALQRARAAVRGGLPGSSQQESLRALGDQRTRAIVEKYMDAMERGDADALVGMLTEDATWCMPPIPTWFAGHELLREFLLRYPLSERWKHLPTRSNGQLAVGCYLFDSDVGSYVPACIDVL